MPGITEIQASRRQVYLTDEKRNEVTVFVVLREGLIQPGDDLCRRCSAFSDRPEEADSNSHRHGGWHTFA